MKHTTIRRGLTAGLGATAATFAAAGFAATAQADDIDLYGGQDVSTFTIYLGTTSETFTTTTNYFDSVDETTGVMTPHFSLPVTVLTMGGPQAGGTSEEGFSFIDHNSQYFGDFSNFLTTDSISTDLTTPAGDITTFDPLGFVNFEPPPILDVDPYPF